MQRCENLSFSYENSSGALVPAVLSLFMLFYEPEEAVGKEFELIAKMLHEILILVIDLCGDSVRCIHESPLSIFMRVEA
jgi:hypothetical protein